jgi:hypothetical protein
MVNTNITYPFYLAPHICLGFILPNTMLQSVERELQDWINQKPGFLLENGLRNVLQYIKTPIEKNIEYCLAEIAKMDQRRNINSKTIFIEFYKELANGHQ